MTSPTETQSQQCPVIHTDQKTVQHVDPSTTSIERDSNGVWQVRGFEEARAILRSGATKQAGFGAGNVAEHQVGNRPSILYLEGQPHHQQRKDTARFFTPKAVSSNYRMLMDSLADRLIAQVRSQKRVDLSQITLTMAVRVAAQVVGLTNSRLPGMSRRLDAFFTETGRQEVRTGLRAYLFGLKATLRVLNFFLLDVKPAIQVRKKTPKDDVISHLIAEGYTDKEILTECLTYGAAGMVTTREFISVAAWHLLERPELRARYLVAGEEERYAMLEEILRLEPVVGNLYRRTTEELTIPSGEDEVIIPSGDLVNLRIHGVNEDPTVVGENGRDLCPGRPLHAERAAPSVMSFGDGHHRCPGSYIAIQESDIFLRKLLVLDGLRIVKPPTVTWNELVTGYELRDFQVAVG